MSEMHLPQGLRDLSSPSLFVPIPAVTDKTCPDSVELTALVNSLRSKHTAQNVSYSAQLAAAAGAHAATLTCRSLAAARNVPYGQNIYGLIGPADRVDDTCSSAVDNWWVNK